MSDRKTNRFLRLRRPAVQAELDLPPPEGTTEGLPSAPPAWWQRPPTVAVLAGLATILLAVAIAARFDARRERAAAAALEAQVRALTLRPATQERALRIVPNRRSWSAAPDAAMRRPEPPELVALYLPVAYAEFPAFAVSIDKVDQGRVLLLHRLVPDSNRDLRLTLNSSAFGAGEYRIRIQGYTWRGQRVDVGWVRLVVK
jgi:hypothetical protein